MSDNEKKKRVINKKPSLAISLAIVIFFAACFIAQVAIWGEPDVHMTLIFASVFAVVLLVIQGTTLKKVEEGVIHGCKIATISMMILMFIGVMIPAWTAAGTIPTLIYYGLQIISPSVFLLTAVIVCALSCLATGTSWGTAATFGVALMGIGHGLGVPPEWTAGAVISGAMFGDTISPISDITNLSAGTCEVNLFKHMKGMVSTTFPGLIVALIVALVMGLKFRGNDFDANQVEAVLSGIRDNFNVQPIYALISIIPMILVIFMAVKKISALATMVTSAITAMIIALLIQGYNLQEMMSFMNYGFVIETGNTDLDTLMNRGGLQSMMWTVSLGYLGLSFGGILEKSGVLDTLLFSANAITKNARNLILAHTGTGIATAMLSASPYVSILIPGRMFVAGYDKLGISRTVASRTCTTSGICIDPITPWTLGGVYYAGVLGVSTLSYAMFTVYAWVVPIVAIIYALFGLFIPKATQEEIEERKAKFKVEEAEDELEKVEEEI